MTEPTAPSPAQPQTGKDFLKNLQSIPLTEKVLGILAVLVILGCLLLGTWFWKSLFHDWFHTLAFFGSLAVAALVILKAFAIRVFTPAIEGKVIAIASLVPMLGLVVASLSSFDGFLRIGGSFALAYISATAYWKRHLPEMPARSEGPPPSGAPAGTTGT